MRKQELTEDEVYMKEALRQARKAYALMEVPIGCVIVYEGKIIAAAITAATQTKTRLPMQKSMRSAGRAKSWETGVWRDARSILHLNRARCVPVRSSSPGLPEL